MFFHLPGVTLPHLPDKLRKKLTRLKIYKNQHEYGVLPLDGTTFSGHPTRTTLGNTIRSLLYGYTICMQAGIEKPWRSITGHGDFYDPNPKVYVMAAGDDVVIFSHPDYVDSIVEQVKLLTAEKKSVDQEKGLGIVVDKISVSHSWDFDFCSKWSFSTGNDLSEWTLTRDLHKAMTQKMFYTKNNLEIHMHPAIHAKALLECVQHDKASRLLENILQYRYDSLVAKDEIDESSKFFRYQVDSVVNYHAKKFLGMNELDQTLIDPHTKPPENTSDYVHEEFINNRLGLTYSSLYYLIATDTLHISS